MPRTALTYSPASASCPTRVGRSAEAVGLSLIDNEAKARRNLKLPMFRQYKGIITLMLNPSDGVVKQTGVHRSHYTWWRTQQFQMSNLKMLQI